jgi:peroxiredoxin
MRLSGRRRAITALATVVVAGAVTSGCAGPTITQQTAQQESSDVATGAADGYQSQDGTIVVFSTDQRPGPISLAGTAYDGSAIDVVDLRGDVVVVNLWFAACPPCRAEIGDLVDLSNDRADEDVHVLGLNTVDDPGTVADFYDEFSVPYPTLDDRAATAIRGLDGVVPLNTNPSTVVIARDGSVYGRIVGMLDASVLNAMVDAALAEDDGAAGP